MRKYAYEYIVDDKKEACSNFTWDYLADNIPCSLSDCIDYVSLVENVLDLEVIKIENGYLILTEDGIDSLSKML